MRSACPSSAPRAARHTSPGRRRSSTTSWASMAGSESAKAQGCCTTRRSTTPARSATSFSIEAPSPTSQIPRRRGQTWCRAEHAAARARPPRCSRLMGRMIVVCRNENDLDYFCTMRLLCTPTRSSSGHTFELPECSAGGRDCSLNSEARSVGGHDGAMSPAGGFSPALKRLPTSSASSRETPRNS
jgi:hypothetical protein